MGSRVVNSFRYEAVVVFVSVSLVKIVRFSIKGIQQTSSMADTHTLVSAIGMGKGLKGIMPPVGGPGPAGMIPPSIRPQASMSSVSPSGANQIGKAPSAIKTNIKSANQIHPYGR